jgi:anti-sigma regulatory factor (Ser/Thr protein kinase)
MQPRGETPGTGAGDRARSGPQAAGGLVTGAPERPAPFGHAALLYRTRDEYTHGVGDFVRAGLAAGEPVLVAVPAAQARVIRDDLGPQAEHVAFAEMVSLGRNPARIIPAVRTFADSHPGQLVRYVGEPAWPGRTAAERAEVVQHEALLNIAFSADDVRILCPYDAARLGPDVIGSAELTHPAIMQNGSVERSSAFPAARATAGGSRPMPSPPPGAPVLTYRDDPGLARRFVRDQAAAAGLGEPRLTDLVIAVGELAANTLRHTRDAGTVRVWAAPHEVLCEVCDRGHIRDPLAGRRCPAADAGHGHGLWVVHQVCDLVEMRTGPAGTVFRLHMGM